MRLFSCAFLIYGKANKLTWGDAAFGSTLIRFLDSALKLGKEATFYGSQFLWAVFQTSNVVDLIEIMYVALMLTLESQQASHELIDAVIDFRFNSPLLAPFEETPWFDIDLWHKYLEQCFVHNSQGHSDLTEFGEILISL